jgi:hypothetical protein
MIKNPLFFFISLMLVAAVVIVIFQLQKQHSNPNLDFAWQQITTLYNKERTQYHGASGEGVGSFPALRGRHLPLATFKEMIQKASGDMQGFPEIKKPLLTTLTNYVQQL